MPGIVSYKFTIEGLDDNILKLRTFSKLLDGIGKKMGILGGGGPGGNNVIVPGGGNNIIPLAQPPASMANTAATAAAAASVGVAGKKISDTIAENWQRLANLGFVNPKPQPLIKITPMAGLKPPIINPWQQFLSSLPPPPKSGIFSRLMNFFKGLDLDFEKLTARTKAINPLMGEMVGKFGKFGIVVGAVIASLFLLKEAIHLLMEGIKHGAEAYIGAAKTGKTVAGSTQVKSALEMLGINEEATEQMLLKGQMGAQKGSKSLYSPAGTDELISTAKSSGFGAANQLMNMPREFADAMEDAVENASDLSRTAQINMTLNMELVSVGRL